MEQTLGKRIMQNRKRMGLTQDALAEQLGVTAQAVSKWENDQSCPDITMLPKLASIFGITTDALLGVEQAPVHEAEPLSLPHEEQETDGIHIQKDGFEFRWDGGKKNALLFPVLVLLVGCLMLAGSLLGWHITFWEILWPSALLVFGLFHMFPRFRFFPFGCALFGGYYLLNNLRLLPFGLTGNVIIPVLIILFGLSLLLDAIRKPHKREFHVHYDGKEHGSNQFTAEDESFTFESSFGESTQPIPLPRLRCGKINVSLGDFGVDLSDVEEIVEDCRIKANCSFGELRLLIPRRFQVRTRNSTSFASIETKGQPDPAPIGTIDLDASVSFGQITVQYI